MTHSNKGTAIGTVKETLTRDEELMLIQASYQNPLGIFIRLALFLGISLEELMALRWEDLDFINQRIYIRHYIIPDCSKLEKGDYILQPAIAPRTLPMPLHMINELWAWHEQQKECIFSTGHEYYPYSPVVTTPSGKPLDSVSLLDAFKKILKSANLPLYGFHILRNTFIRRSLQDGMTFATLSAMIGRPFIINPNPYLSNNQLTQFVTRAEYLGDIQRNLTSEIKYPVLVRENNLGLQFYLPNFPDVRLIMIKKDVGLEEGLNKVREMILLQLQNCISPPPPTPVETICLAPNECIILLSINP